MNKVILLTGVAGFIGSHTAKYLLERGDTVVGVDNMNDYYSVELKESRIKRLSADPHFHFYQVDIADETVMGQIGSAHKIDAICHLAAQAGVRYSLEHPLTYIHSNILGTTVIFELAKKWKISHVVYASSSSVYGNSPADKPFAEDINTDQPISLYAASKKACEVIAHTYYHLYDIQATGLRFFTVYGPWGRPDMAAYKFATAILADQPIDVYNYGKMKRDFTYIDDIVRGIVASLDMPLGYQLFNLGGSNTVELSYFIELLEKNLGKEAKKNLLPMQAGDVPGTSADISKAQKLLDWTPRVAIEEGVRNFCQWFLQYHN